MGRIDYSNVVGQRFGYLEVISEEERDPKYGPRFLCQCDCGNQKVILGHSLIKGYSKSCGCRRGCHGDYSSIIGKRYGKLTVVRYEGLHIFGGNRSGSAYLCRCDCGNEVLIPKEQLIGDKRRSCGRCFRIVKEKDYYRYICPDERSFIFDLDDYDIVASKKWSISPQLYPTSSDNKKHVRLGVWLMHPRKGQFVDHINGDRLDNRRSNLRLASPADNNRNSSLQKNNTTGYKGVTFKAGRYEATCYVDSKGKHLGRFDTPEEAARAYDEAARFYYGEFACVNFPKEGEQGCRRKEKVSA